MRITAQPGSYSVRRAGRWCLWGVGLSLALVLLTGFIGMAHKEVCLPQASHCAGDPIQNALILLYVGSLITLVISLMVGLTLATVVAVRAGSRHWRHA